LAFCSLRSLILANNFLPVNWALYFTMKWFTQLALLFILIGCALTNEKPEKVNLTCDSVITEIYDSLTEEQISDFKKYDLNSFIGMHHIGWGTNIRNHYGLWSKGSVVTSSCAQKVGQSNMHPEGASSVILEGVWGLVHGKI
jgi:hypothetical protein